MNNVEIVKHAIVLLLKYLYVQISQNLAVKFIATMIFNVHRFTFFLISHIEWFVLHDNIILIHNMSHRRSRHMRAVANYLLRKTQ